MWLFEAFFTAFRPVLSDSDETRIAPQAIYATVGGNLGRDMTDTNWGHIKTVFDGDRFELEGINVWDCDWITTNNRISVKDPLYGQEYRMTVFEIRQEDKVITFAAGEFSNCVWGFYQNQSRK